MSDIQTKIDLGNEVRKKVDERKYEGITKRYPDVDLLSMRGTKLLSPKALKKYEDAVIETMAQESDPLVSESELRVSKKLSELDVKLYDSNESEDYQRVRSAFRSGRLKIRRSELDNLLKMERHTLVEHLMALLEDQI